jgi:hypothetical protein
MQTNPIEGRTGDVRDQAEGAVLSRVLELHPRLLTERDLSLDLVGDTLAGRCELYEYAIRGLIDAGLLCVEGTAVVPTAAAIRAAEVTP